MELSKQEQAIMETAMRLQDSFSVLDLDHDAHAVFMFALEATKKLVLRHEHPLACQLAKQMIDNRVMRWRMINQRSAA